MRAWCRAQALFANLAVERLTLPESSKLLNRKGRKENHKGREEARRN